MGARGFWKATTNGIVATIAWLSDHEPVRFGAAVQAVVVGLTGWLMVEASRLELPNNIAEVIAGLIGAAILRKIEEWKRSRVASASTAAKLLAREPPKNEKPPIPLAEEKAEAKP